MDYTLILYNEDSLEDLAYRGAIEYLLSELKYPKEISKFTFNPSKVIRGLVVDKQEGALLKINRFGYVKAALYGHSFLERDQLKRKYQDFTVHFNDSRFEVFPTMFNLALGCLYSDLVELGNLKKTYEELFLEVTEAINEIHRNGYLKSRIISDPARYVRKEPELIDTLLMFKSFGKSLALVTNSEWDYTDQIMKFVCQDFLGKLKNWSDLFEVVVVDAQKPDFFSGNNKFYEVISQSGHLKNVTGGLKKGGIYQGGNSKEIEKLFQVSPSQILFVGDHIYSDVYQSKRSCRWRTMLVIHELEEDLLAAKGAHSHLASIEELMKEKEELELNVDVLKMEEKGCLLRKDPFHQNPKDLPLLREEIKKIDESVRVEILEFEKNFNIHWGELMWAGNDQSYLGMAIERYACVYTSRVSNFLNYSPVHYFRPKLKTYF